MTRKPKSKPSTRAARSSSGTAGQHAKAVRHIEATPLEDDQSVPDIRTREIIDPRTDKIIREPTAEPASWRDPADTSPHRRKAKVIEGYRAADALRALQNRGAQITRLHMQAANKLRTSYELGEIGARPGYERPEISSPYFGPCDGPQTVRLDNLKKYREAKASVPRSQWPILEHVVIRNASVRSYAAEQRMRRDQAVGYLIAALDCLVDHYGLRDTQRQHKRKTS